MRRIFLIWLFALLLPLSSNAGGLRDGMSVSDAGLEYGLHIATYPSHAHEISGLALEDGKPISVKGKTLEMSFDLFNRPENVFGCIFRIITDKGENVDLMYTADLQDARKLIMVTGEQVHFIGAEIPIEEWINVKVRLNTKDGNIELDYNGVPFTFRDAGTKGAESFRINFGLCQLAGYTLGDVASINVRNIGLSLNGKPYRIWECSRHDGDLCYDQLKGIPAKAINPKWLIDSYISFRPVFSRSYSSCPSITFDGRDKFYLTWGNKPIRAISAIDGSEEDIAVNGGRNPANYPNQLFFIPGADERLVAYNLDEDIISTFDFGAGKWDNDKEPQTDHSYWNNTNAWDSGEQALYSFGAWIQA